MFVFSKKTNSQSLYSEETIADLSADRFDFGSLSKFPDIYAPSDKNKNEGKLLITKKYFEIYLSMFSYLESYKADDVDAYIALMKVLIPNFAFFLASLQFTNMLFFALGI